MNQIKCYEASTAQPTLDTLVKLANALHMTLDELVFNEQEHSPSANFRMQFEALSQFSEKDKLMAKEFLDILILKQMASLLAATG